MDKGDFVLVACSATFELLNQLLKTFDEENNGDSLNKLCGSEDFEDILNHIYENNDASIREKTEFALHMRNVQNSQVVQMEELMMKRSQVEKRFIIEVLAGVLSEGTTIIISSIVYVVKDSRRSA